MENWESKLKLYIATIVVLALVVAALLSCKPRTYGIVDVRSEYDKVMACTGVTPKIRPKLITVAGDSVMCGGKKKGGCYDNGKITLPKNTNLTTLRHELVHHVCRELGYQNDPDHKCMLKSGDSPYLKCSGLMED